MLCARRWSDAGPAGRGKVLASTVHCRELKTGQQKVQLYYADDPLCLSRYITYLLAAQCKFGRKFSWDNKSCFSYRYIMSIRKRIIIENLLIEDDLWCVLCTRGGLGGTAAHPECKSEQKGTMLYYRICLISYFELYLWLILIYSIITLSLLINQL